jgi:hypothetical protein
MKLVVTNGSCGILAWNFIAAGYDCAIPPYLLSFAYPKRIDKKCIYI